MTTNYGMRRPLLWAAAAFLGGILIQHYRGGITMLVVAFWAAFWTVFWAALTFKGNSAHEWLSRSLTRRTKKTAAALICCFLAGAVWMAADQRSESFLVEHLGEQAEITGVIRSFEDRGDQCRIVIEEGYVRLEKDGILVGRSLGRRRVLAVVKKEQEHQGKHGLEPSPQGKRVTVTGAVTLPSGSRNPGAFDYRLYLKTQRVDVMLLGGRAWLEQKPGQELGAVGKRWLSWIGEKKQAFQSEAAERMGAKTCGLLIGMLFGDKSLMDEEVMKGFQRNGGAHILAVSGIHAGIVHRFTGKLVRGRKGVLPSLFTLAVLIFYAALADFSPSVVRAVLMIATAVFAGLLNRRYDMLSACAFAFLIQLLANPHTLFHSGFQMSYLAVAVIAVVLPWAEHKAQRLLAFTKKTSLKSRVLEGAVPLTVIQAGMMPVTAFVFHYLSLTSFLLNPPLLLLGAMALPVGIALFAVNSLPFQAPEGAIIFLFAAAEGLLSSMIALSDKLTALGRGVFDTASPPVGVLMLWYGLAFLLTGESWYLLLRKKKKGLAAAAAAAVVLAASIVPWSVGLADHPHPFSRLRYDLVFVDVGQGDCLHIRTPSGRNVLIDGGGSAFRNVGEDVLLPYLLKNGVTELDAAVVTHMHTDHFKGIEELAERMPVKRLILYEGYEQETRHKEIRAGERIYVGRGDVIRLDEDVQLEVLHPQRKTEAEYAAMNRDGSDENAMSLMVKVHFRGVSALMTADIGFDGEREVMKAAGLWEESSELSGRFDQSGQFGRLKSHLLKAGHHGSKYSTSPEFLEAVNPQSVIVQVGRNNFGHPNPQVIELFSQCGIMVGRNDLDGAVTVKINRKGEAAVSSMLGEYKWLIKQ